MGMMDAVRRAEEKAEDLARRGTEAAREEADDASRRVRRKMRVYPTTPGNAGTTPDAKAREMEDARHKAIVSVNGEDVDEEALNSGGTRRVA